MRRYWNDDAAGQWKNGPLLDWGEKPFGIATAGIAWDGKNLWALDAKNKRICVIEKTESGKEITASLNK